ncbi:hypothetical protein V1478_001114 [Vespula squamosa]|uniref:Uncharacterized protein n=1 Tax=Vespula squamosa TaxID=30214 RepID=A0ABD2C9I0_VESSQ
MGRASRLTTCVSNNDAHRRAFDRLKKSKPPGLAEKGKKIEKKDGGKKENGDPRVEEEEESYREEEFSFQKLVSPWSRYTTNENEEDKCRETILIPTVKEDLQGRQDKFVKFYQARASKKLFSFHRYTYKDIERSETIVNYLIDTYYAFGETSSIIPNAIKMVVGGNGWKFLERTLEEPEKTTKPLSAYKMLVPYLVADSNADGTE